MPILERNISLAGERSSKLRGIHLEMAAGNQKWRAKWPLGVTEH